MNSVLHYIRGKHGYIEAGFGLQLLMLSKTILPKGVAGIADGPSSIKNSEFKPVMPIIPVATGWRGDLMIYTLRIETGLLNRYRHELKQYGRNFYGLVSLEVGMRI